MTESTFWSVIQPKLAPYGVFERIENPLVPGMADLSYCIRGVEGWAELKHVDQWPTSRLKLPHFSKEQHEWHLNRAKHGSRTCLLIQVARDYLIIPPHAITEVFYGLPKDRYLDLAAVHATHVFPTHAVVKYMMGRHPIQR